MEVSSHALALQRVDGDRFAAAMFTNLTRDHLDFHADMEAYFLAKRRLFEMLEAAAPALINLDDPTRRALVETGGRPVTYGLNRAGRRHARDGVVLAPGAGVRRAHAARHGSREVGAGRPAERLQHPRGGVAGIALDLPLDAIERGIASLAGVPGRFEVVSAPPTESPSWSTTPTPTTRSGTCSRPPGRWPAAGSSRCSAAAAIAIAPSAR